MLQHGLADHCCKAIQVRLATMKSTLQAYNASSQLVISVKSTLVDNPNVIKEGYARQHDKSVPA